MLMVEDIKRYQCSGRCDSAVAFDVAQTREARDAAERIHSGDLSDGRQHGAPFAGECSPCGGGEAAPMRLWQ